MNTDEIKAWLKKTGMSRQEFGKKVGVSKSSVDNWLAGVSPIPAGRLALIQELIEQPSSSPAPAPAPLSIETVKVLNVILTRDEFKLCAEAALACHMDLAAWARLVVLERTAAVAAKGKGETS